MADATPEHLAGLLIPDDRLTYWADESSGVTEYSPFPDQPEPDRATAMALYASAPVGATITAGTHLHVQTQRGGIAVAGAAGFYYYEDGETDYYGADVPIGITHVALDEWWTTTFTYNNRHSVRLADQTVVQVADRTGSGGGAVQAVVVTIFDPDTETWGAQSIVYSQATGMAWDLHPCLLLLPSGELRLFHWVFDTENEIAQIRMWASVDKGATWEEAADYVLDADVDIAGTPGPAATGGDPGRLRAAYQNGQVLLVAGEWLHKDIAYQDVLRQWASSDGGYTFTEISAASTIAGGGFDLVCVGGWFVLLYIRLSSSASDSGRWCRVADAFAPLASADSTALPATLGQSGITGSITLDDPDLAACVTPEGHIYAYARRSYVDHAGQVVRSPDHGGTFELLGTASGAGGSATAIWWDANTGGASAVYPTGFTVCPYKGGVMMIAGWEATAPGSYAGSQSWWILGGYSTVTHPSVSLFRSGVHQASWSGSQAGLDKPDSNGWTLTGTDTASIVNGALSVSTSSQQTRYDLTVTTTIARGIMGRWVWDPSSGGSLSGDRQVIRAILDDAAEDYDVSIRFAAVSGETHIRVYDNNAGGAVGSDIDTNSAEPIEVLWHLADGAFVLYWRVAGSGRRAYNAGPSTDALTDGGGGAGTSEIRWGSDIVNTDAWTAHLWQWAIGDSVGQGLIGATFPDDLYPAPFVDAAVYVHENIHVRARGGPTRPGDSWQIELDSDTPLRAMDPLGRTPSPRVPWENDADGAAVSIAYQIDGGLGQVSHVGGDLMAFGFVGLNVRDIEIEYYSGGSWTQAIAIDAAEDLGAVSYTREGNTVRPAAAAALAPRWLTENELAGGTWAAGAVRRTIVGNTAGAWVGATTQTQQQVVIFLDPDEVASGDPTSGTCAIWAPQVVGVVRLSTWRTAQGWRIVLPSQTTASGRYKIGGRLIGRVLPFGYHPSRGWQLRLEPNTELVTARDGTRRAQELGPARQIWALPFSDLVPERKLLQASPAPDYILATTTAGAHPVATRQGVLRDLFGALRTLRGARRICGLLPYIARGSSGADATSLPGKRFFSYGRLTGNFAITNAAPGAMGLEHVVRGESIVHEEEV